MSRWTVQLQGREARFRRDRAARLLGTVALGLALVSWGCSVAPMPPDRFYPLGVVGASSPAGACRLPGVLVVNRPTADSLTDQRKMVYRPAGQSEELRRSDYFLWVDPPTALIQSRLVSYLQKRGVSETIVTPDLRAQADYALSGRIVEMHRSLGDSPTITLALDLSLLRVSDRQVLVQSSGVETRPAATIDDAIRAYESAAADLFDGFVAECQSRLSASGARSG